MKYLYKILRLFLCPHKYKIIATSDIVTSVTTSITGTYARTQCKYCGKIKSYVDYL